jgi:hypothetical protein
MKELPGRMSQRKQVIMEAGPFRKEQWPGWFLASLAPGICSFVSSILVGTREDIHSGCDHPSRKMCWQWQIHDRSRNVTSKLSTTFSKQMTQTCSVEFLYYISSGL